jgi:cell division initiation protein
MGCTAVKAAEAAMRITPRDVRNHPFQKRLSGYDREEVDAFLRMVAEDYEGVMRESAGLRERGVKLEARVDELAANEAVLQEILISAQNLSEDLKRTAIKEAEVVVGEAEIKAEKILTAAHRRAAKLAADIREMQLLRTRLAASVRAVIETHLNLLDGLATPEKEDPILAGKVSYLAQGPKQAQTGGKG